MPKSVLRVKLRIFDLTALDVLKGIFPVHRQLIDLNLSVFEKSVFARERTMVDGDIDIPPKEFRRKDIAITQTHFSAFPKGFDSMEFAVFDFNVVVVPKCSPTFLRENAIRNPSFFIVPKRIAKIKIACFCKDIAAFFERALPICRPFETTGDKMDIFHVI